MPKGKNNKKNQVQTTSVNHSEIIKNGAKKTNNSPVLPNANKAQGLYRNDRFVQVMTAMIGSKSKIINKNGSSFSGVFNTIGDNGEIAVSACHREDLPFNGRNLVVRFWKQKFMCYL